MTGYGVGHARLGQGCLSIEVRAVNHRYLDLRVRLPRELTDFTMYTEDLARRRLHRGRVELTGRLEGEPCGVPALNIERARTAFEALRKLRDDLGVNEPVPLALLSSVPELFSNSCNLKSDETREALGAAVTEACDALNEMRKKEGAALANDLTGRLAQIMEAVATMNHRCPEAIACYRRRLHERMERFLSGTELQVDAGRIEQEIAIFADRTDVAEEISRLQSHCGQFQELIQDESLTLGRKLDFLLQEMTREANTIGAKSADLGISRVVVEIKADLERMREQVQNVV